VRGVSFTLFSGLVRFDLSWTTWAYLTLKRLPLSVVICRSSLQWSLSVSSDSALDYTWSGREVVQWIYYTLHVQSGTKFRPGIVIGTKRDCTCTARADVQWIHCSEFTAQLHVQCGISVRLRGMTVLSLTAQFKTVKNKHFTHFMEFHLLFGKTVQDCQKTHLFTWARWVSVYHVTGCCGLNWTGVSQYLYDIRSRITLSISTDNMVCTWSLWWRGEGGNAWCFHIRNDVSSSSNIDRKVSWRCHRQKHSTDHLQGAGLVYLQGLWYHDLRVCLWSLLVYRKLCPSNRSNVRGVW
jgi:hypothetical protein